MLSSATPEPPAPIRLAGLMLMLGCALSGFAAETPRTNDAAPDDVEDRVVPFVEGAELAK
jgi:hypothetical protein